MKTHQDTIAAFKVLQPFIGRAQRLCLLELCQSEERQFFFDKLCELAEIVASMPKTGETDGQGGSAVCQLHYFIGGCDWHITERDAESPDWPGQHQAFGVADLGYGPELGYISIAELVENGAELDLHFTRCAVVQILEPATL